MRAQRRLDGQSLGVGQFDFDQSAEKFHELAIHEYEVADGAARKGTALRPGGGVRQVHLHR